MAKKPLNFGNKQNDFDNQQIASKEVESTTETKKLGKKPNTDFIRLDLKPRGGEDLLAYCSERCGQLGKVRGKRVTTTAFIQELIMNDMEAQKGKKKLSKREASIEKIVTKLDNLDDSLIYSIENIIDKL